jgi:hypothetical protein
MTGRASIIIEAPITDSPWYDGWWRFGNRSWRFWWAPLVDDYKGISITRVIALLFAGFVGLSIDKQGGVVGANTLWLGLASISAAFGKSTFTFLLSRAEQKTQAVEQTVNQTVRKVSHEVIERIQSTRDKSTGEPGPMAPGQELPAGATVVDG